MDPFTFNLMWQNNNSSFKLVNSVQVNGTNVISYPTGILPGDVLVVLQRASRSTSPSPTLVPAPGFTTVRVDARTSASPAYITFAIEVKIATGTESGSMTLTPSSGGLFVTSLCILQFRSSYSFSSFTTQWSNIAFDAASTSLTAAITGRPSPGLLLSQFFCATTNTIGSNASSSPVMDFTDVASFHKVYYNTYLSPAASNPVFTLTDTGVYNAIQSAYVSFL